MRPSARRSSRVCRAQQGDSRWQMHEQGAAPASCGTWPLGPRASLPLPGCLRGGTAGTVCPSSNQLCAPSQRPCHPAPPLRASVRAASATPCAPPPTRCTHCATLVPCAHLLWLERRTPAWPGCEAGAGKLAAASSGSGSKGRKRDLAIAPELLTAHTYWPGRRTLAQLLAGHGCEGSRCPQQAEWRANRLRLADQLRWPEGI